MVRDRVRLRVRLRVRIRVRVRVRVSVLRVRVRVLRVRVYGEVAVLDVADDEGKEVDGDRLLHLEDELLVTLNDFH